MPARAYLSILIVFALIIGPVNYWFLWRRRQQVLLVLTAPLVSAIFIVLLAGYVVAGEGLAVSGRAVTFTMLDQARKEAVMRASASLYAAGMTPGGGLRFARDVAVFPIGTDGTGTRDTISARPDRESALLVGRRARARADQLRGDCLASCARAADVPAEAAGPARAWRDQRPRRHDHEAALPQRRADLQPVGAVRAGRQGRPQAGRHRPAGVVPSGPAAVVEIRAPRRAISPRARISPSSSAPRSGIPGSRRSSSATAFTCCSDGPRGSRERRDARTRRTRPPLRRRARG